MSIIYDALKKVEQSNIKDANTQHPSKETHTKHRVKTYLVYILAVCAGLFLINIFFKLLAHPLIISKVAVKSSPAAVQEKEQPKKEQPKPAAPIQQAAASGSPLAASSSGMLVLNGIFFSEDGGYALINNHIVKEGDTVDRALVKRIGEKEVELEVDGSNLKLTTAQR